MINLVLYNTLVRYANKNAQKRLKNQIEKRHDFQCIIALGTVKLRSRLKRQCCRTRAELSESLRVYYLILNINEAMTRAAQLIEKLTYIYVNSWIPVK